MKKLIAIMLAAGLFAALPGSASAGGRGGYGGHGGYYGHGGHGVGGFFAGLVGGAILGTVLSHAYEPVYAPPPRVYYAPSGAGLGARAATKRAMYGSGSPGIGRWSGIPVVGKTRTTAAPGPQGMGPRILRGSPARVWLPGHWEERG